MFPSKSRAIASDALTVSPHCLLEAALSRDFVTWEQVVEFVDAFAGAGSLAGPFGERLEQLLMDLDGESRRHRLMEFVRSNARGNHLALLPDILASWRTSTRKFSDNDFSPHLFESDEGRTSVITELYLEVLGRMPDPGGLAAYTEYLAEGHTAEDVASLLRGSAEFREAAPPRLEPVSSVKWDFPQCNCSVYDLKSLHRYLAAETVRIGLARETRVIPPEASWLIAMTTTDGDLVLGADVACLGSVIDAQGTLSFPDAGISLFGLRLDLPEGDYELDVDLKAVAGARWVLDTIADYGMAGLIELPGVGSFTGTVRFRVAAGHRGVECRLETLSPGTEVLIRRLFLRPANRSAWNSDEGSRV